jgi:hypothetical protein
MPLMYAIDFRQIKVRSCPKISWCIVVHLIIKEDVSMPVEVQGDVSAPLVLKFFFSTSTTVGSVAQSV